MMRVPESLRRPDWLKELQVLLIVALLVVGALGVAGAVTAIRDSSLPVELPASAVAATVEHGLRQGAAVAPVQDVELLVADPDAGQRAAWMMTSLPTYAVVVALLVLLLRIVWHARRSDPFTQATVRRLRVLAVVALGGYLAALVEAVASLLLTETVLVDGMLASFRLPLYWFPIAFGLFAVAEVVKRGCAMRDELETVV